MKVSLSGSLLPVVGISFGQLDGYSAASRPFDTHHRPTKIINGFDLRFSGTCHGYRGTVISYHTR